MEMPIMPTQPNTAPAAGNEAAVDADAPEGAFEEMLARRLGRQLVGRFAREHGDGAAAGTDGEPTPWMPPAAGHEADPTTPATDPAAPAGMITQEPATPTPVDRPAEDTAIAAAPQPTPVRIRVNRPGFPAPIAQPGIIQPGPIGEVWTHPSGLANLELTRSATADANDSPVVSRSAPRPILDAATAMETTAPAKPMPEPTSEPTPQPPGVHWSPAPARAALAAAANRDLELEIVTQMVRSTDQAQSAEPRLRLVAADTLDPAALQSAQAQTGGDLGPMESTSPSAGITANGASPLTAPPHSALVERVMNAVEMQQHLPPPRAIAIEIPEIEGLRLLVTMRMDGTVHVATSGTSTDATNQQVASLLQAVNDALTERGFDMSADTGGRQHAGHDAEDQPVRPRSNRFRRTARRAGLRI